MTGPSKPQLIDLSSPHVEPLDGLSGDVSDDLEGLVEVKNGKRSEFGARSDDQVGEGWRAVLTPVGDEQFDNYEGCLSVPNLRGVVKRFVHLHLKAWDRHGQPIDEVVHGLKAGTFQHEVDHLNGKVFVDRADPSTFTTWTEFERHHRAAFVEQVTQLVARVGS